jgi:FkbM family methyltransferase
VEKYTGQNPTGLRPGTHQETPTLADLRNIMESNQRNPSKTSILKQLGDTGFPIECVLDVGIHFGTHELMRAFPEKKHYLFEPIEEHFESIEEVYNKSGIDFDLNKVAVSNNDGTAELTVSTVLDGHEVTHARFAEGELPKETLRTVPTLKLDTFVANQAPASPFLLKIDVDGAEEMILEGAQEALESCSILIIEATRDRLFDRMQMAKDAGFELLDIIDFCYYDGFLAQVDLVFVNPKYAPPALTDLFKGGFTIEKWHNYAPRSKKPSILKQVQVAATAPQKDDEPKQKRGLSRLFRKR